MKTGDVGTIHVLVGPVAMAFPPGTTITYLHCSPDGVVEARWSEPGGGADPGANYEARYAPGKEKGPPLLAAPSPPTG